MSDQPPYAAIASLFGDPARALMVDVLMDGSSHSASELAEVAGISPQTASGHLAKLKGAGLLAMEASGRHRLYRLANHRVAEAVEVLSLLAADMPVRWARAPRRDIRTARICYDHLAGRLGVELTRALLRSRHIRHADGEFLLTRSGRRFLAEVVGVNVDGALRERRSFACACLDWSERESHMAGSLGAALASRCFHAGWVTRQAEGRGLSLTRKGEAAFRKHFGLKL